MTIAINTKKGWFLWFLLTSIFSVMAVLKYHNLNSTYFDLGVFLNNFYMISLGQWQRIFLSHVQPLNFFFSLPYQISPSLFPAFLLVTQSSLLALPVIGLYKHYGSIPAIAFSLYFPLWYIALFDFHIDHLAIPLLFGFFFLERQGKIGLAITLAVLLALVKEIFALQVAFCGIFLILSRKKWAAGMFLFAFGIIYFYFATHYFLRYFSMAPLMDPLSSLQPLQTPFALISKNEVQTIIFIASNLHHIFWEILTNPDKIKYLIYIFGALGFISFLKPRTLLVLFPILAINLFFPNKLYYGYSNHYTAGLIAPMIIAFAEGLPTAQQYWKKLKFSMQIFTPVILLCLFSLHILISPSPIGRHFYLKESRLNYSSTYKPEERNEWIKSKIIKFIPSDPNIILSVQNSINFGYLVQRKNIFSFPDGVINPATVVDSSMKTWGGFLKYIRSGELEEILHDKKLADYVILDLKKPWFISENGYLISCHWVEGKCSNAKNFEERFLHLVDTAKKFFETIYDNDQFMILKRSSSGHP
ncbi:MAG TPA: DUF2079 domain-containing protein [Nitrospinaceae bacterium]|nr:DUF2079 domain-containing protein [Nitrospinaceae bacterium]